VRKGNIGGYSFSDVGVGVPTIAQDGV